jgi:hypothetical protein
MSLENSKIINERLGVFLGENFFKQLKNQKNIYDQIYADLSYCRNHVLDRTSPEKELLFNVFQEQMVNFYAEIFFGKVSKLTQAHFNKKIVEPFKKYGNLLNIDAADFTESDRAEHLDYKFKLLETYFVFKGKYELVNNAHNSKNQTRKH